MSDSQKIKGSRAYSKAKKRADDYLKDPARLNDLVDIANKKARVKQGALDAIWAQFLASIRLLRAFASGSYREIPWSSLALLVTAVVYFVMPIDLIPDFIVGFGFVDDSALLGWTLNTLKKELDAFLEWEAEHWNRT